MASIETRSLNESGDVHHIDRNVHRGRSDAHGFFAASQLRDACKYYDENGYFVLTGAIEDERCDEARQCFVKEFKDFAGYWYRQSSSGRAETNKFTEHGFLENSILNIQDLPGSRFAKFKNATLNIFTHKSIQQACAALFGEAGKIVQTMYFEGNPATWSHQDTYYLDSEHIGAMTALWIALEDIHPGAGRFYVYPGSHKIDMGIHDATVDIAFNHDVYKAKINEVVKRHGLERRAPALKKGDILFWNARTIHGSLETTAPQFSRNSLTCHVIPRSHRFLQFQSRVKGLDLKTVNGVEIHHPKDQGKLNNRLIYFLECNAPGLFYAAKALAVRAVTSLPRRT